MVHLHNITSYYAAVAIANDETVSAPTREAARRAMLRLGTVYANVFFDYGFMICMGEARHAKVKCTHWIPDTGIFPKGGTTRGKVMVESRAYSPFECLPALIDIFDKPWSSSYGGKAWKRIAEFVAQRPDFSDVIFVDHLVDMEHNGGNIFNKTEATHVLDFDMDWGSMKNFLNYKAKNGFLFGELSTYNKFLDLEVGRLAVSAYGSKINIANFIPTPAGSFDYTPVVYGEKTLPDIKPTGWDGDEDNEPSEEENESESSGGNPGNLSVSGPSGELLNYEGGIYHAPSTPKLACPDDVSGEKVEYHESQKALYWKFLETLQKALPGYITLNSLESVGLVEVEPHQPESEPLGKPIPPNYGEIQPNDSSKPKPVASQFSVSVDESGQIQFPTPTAEQLSGDQYLQYAAEYQAAINALYKSKFGVDLPN